MGTNYYLHVLKDDACAHCKRPATIERLHIGKSSAGWCFALHVIPERNLRDLVDWVLLMAFAPPGTEIKDEYGRSTTFNELMEVIALREWSPAAPTKWSPTRLRENNAEHGPNGLVRARVNAGHCIGHGSGTWDLIIGEFS